MPFKDIIGFDLGTSKFRFYKEGKLVSEVPIGLKNNSKFSAVMKEGKIANFAETRSIIQQELKKLIPTYWGIFTKPIKRFISVPSDMNEIALRAFADLMQHTGSQKTFSLIDTLIIARGLGIDIPNNVYTIVDCGAGKTSITTMNGYEIISNRIIDYAGRSIDENIMTYIRRLYNCEITQEQAEELKITHTSLIKNMPDYSLIIKGKDRSDNRNKEIRLLSSELSNCILESVDYIKEIIVRHLHELDTSIAIKAKDNGIHCVGNCFKLKGFIDYIADDIDISTESYNVNADYMQLGMESVISNPNDLLEYIIEI